MQQKDLTYEIALGRFAQNLCSTCGGSMERRARLNDYYYHKCRRPWDFAKLQALKEEIPLLEPVRKPKLVPVDPRKGKSSFFRRLVQR